MVSFASATTFAQLYCKSKRSIVGIFVAAFARKYITQKRTLNGASWFASQQKFGGHLFSLGYLTLLGTNLGK